MRVGEEPNSFSKVFKNFQNLIINVFILYFIIFFSLPFLGLYKSYPLNRNLVLEICKERVYTHIVSTHMHEQRSQHDAKFISNIWGQLDLIFPSKIISYHLLTKVTSRSYK
jgi:hypothetical protein